MDAEREIEGCFFAVIPAKDPDLGKSRLAPVLNLPQRRALNLELARSTVEVCAAYLGGERTIVVTSSSAIRRIAEPFGAVVLEEEEGACGMNGALRAGAKVALDSGAMALVAIPTDLPLLSIPLLRSALANFQAQHECLLVPDRRGMGTNLMAISPADPELFSFGERSLERHEREARIRGYRVKIHRSAELSLDLDTADDLRFYLALAETRLPIDGAAD
ncbi:MAG TPA: 2-phospho-L-lactate guanylyltransferase [Burkholderiales bacterium]|nr:2-phospho-L-lactate guanylyltransferase [Burkholderiales bacterium]